MPCKHWKRLPYDANHAPFLLQSKEWEECWPQYAELIDPWREESGRPRPFWALGCPQVHLECYLSPWSTSSEKERDYWRLGATMNAIAIALSKVNTDQWMRIEGFIVNNGKSISAAHVDCRSHSYIRESIFWHAWRDWRAVTSTGKYRIEKWVNEWINE